MIRRLYVHNFRCLENFELPISGQPSVLLIGKNGSGKTSVGLVLRLLQQIARHANRVGDLIEPKDFTRGRMDVPMRFEIEVELDTKAYQYVIALDCSTESKELRVFEEKLTVNGDPLYTRSEATTIHPGTGARGKGDAFPIDRQFVALPIIYANVGDDLFLFKQWLARMLILRPIPNLISGNSSEATLLPSSQVTDFGAWFSGLLAHSPWVYSKIDSYLKQMMPDLNNIKNPEVGKYSRSLEVQFSTDQGSVTLPFSDLSDGEKCFMICALVLAANEAYGPLLCFWDEPDNFLAPSEVRHFVMALRKAFQTGGQLIATSHNAEAIRSFSDENTLVLHRENHLEPTKVRPLAELNVSGDLISALVRGDVE